MKAKLPENLSDLLKQDIYLYADAISKYAFDLQDDFTELQKNYVRAMKELLKWNELHGKALRGETKSLEQFLDEANKLLEEFPPEI